MNRLIKAMLGFVALFAAQCAGASIIHFTAVLSGAAESPPNASPGLGSAAIDVDTDLDTMSITATFAGLLGSTTASHIHCCTAAPDSGTAGVATTLPAFPGFPLGVTSGNYIHTFDLTNPTTYNPAFIMANGGTLATAEAALLTGMLGGKSYFNIHTVVAPAGEIRGFLVPAAVGAVPEPWTAGLLGIGLAAALLGRRTERRWSTTRQPRG